MEEETTSINLLKENMVYEAISKENTNNKLYKSVHSSIKIPTDEIINEEVTEKQDPKQKAVDFIHSISYELPTFTKLKKVSKIQILFLLILSLVFNFIYPLILTILNNTNLLDQIFKDILELTKSSFLGLFIASLILFTSKYMHKILNYVVSYNFIYIFITCTLFFCSFSLPQVQLKIKNTDCFFIKQFYKLRKENYQIETFNSILILILIAKLFIDFIFFLEFQNFYAQKVEKIKKLKLCINLLNNRKYIKKTDFINNAFEEFPIIMKEQIDYPIKGIIPEKLILFAEKNQKRNFMGFLNKIILEVQGFPKCLEEFKNRYIYIQFPILIIVSYLIFSYLNISGKNAEKERVMNTAIIFSFTPIFYTVFKREFVPLFYSYLFCFQQRKFDISDTIFINKKMHKCIAITPFTSEFISEGKNITICNSEYIKKPYSILYDDQAVYEIEWQYSFLYMKSFNKISYLKNSINEFITDNSAFFFEDFNIEFVKVENNKSMLFIKFKLVYFIDRHIYEENLRNFRLFLETEFRRLEFY